MPKQLSQDVVLQWVTLASGNFNTRQMWSELNIITPEGKAYLRVCLERLVKAGAIAKTSLDGTFRKIDNEKQVLEWETADTENYLPIQLPFDLHKYCLIYPKSIIVVAGGKDGGKTAFLLETLKLNCSHFTIDFFNSETGKEQFKKRILPLHLPYPIPFNTYQRYDNFADVIEPDHFSIIDYLDFNSEVYLVGTEIDAIFRKKTTGVAVIGLQKPPPTRVLVRGKLTLVERDLAYGGAFSIKRAVLYISLSGNRLKVISAKTPADPKVRLANMQWSYSFDNNGFFTNIQRYYGDTNDTL